MPDREYFNNRRKERRLRFTNLLGGKCERCGTTENLHFDHRNPKKKEFRIADNIDAPEDILLKEVNKCILLCNKCHRDKTRENNEHGQPIAQHGTLHYYKKYHCRCQRCKNRMSKYNKQRKLNLDNIMSLNDLTNDLLKLATNPKEEKTPAKELYTQAFEILYQLAKETNNLDKDVAKPLVNKVLELAKVLSQLGRVM